MEKNNKLTIIPVMLCFFAMGFVDLVGTASNYVKSDLGLNDVQANIFPSLVFFWFLIFSVPTGVLMNKIGRKKTVLLSLAITFISLLLPLFGESYVLMLIAFSLLGIGNALMQTSLNPLVSTVIKGGNLASTLTFGDVAGSGTTPEPRFLVSHRLPIHLPHPRPSGSAGMRTSVHHPTHDSMHSALPARLPDRYREPLLAPHPANITRTDGFTME